MYIVVYSRKFNSNEFKFIVENKRGPGELSGCFKSKETDFHMSNSLINYLTSTNQTKLVFMHNVC